MTLARSPQFRIAALAAALCASAARAGAQPVAEPEPVTQGEWVTRAADLESEVRPAEARAAWARALELAPASRLARRAERRLEYLDARSEGAFAPLETLWRFQRTPAADRRAETLEALERAIESMPVGRVRAEARMALAGAWAELGETERSLAAYRTLEGEPFLDDGERSVLAEDVAHVYAGAGRIEEAIAALERTGEDEHGAIAALARASRERVLVPLAWGLVGTFLVAVAVALGRARGRRELVRDALGPARLCLAATLALAPLAIARWLGDEATLAFEGLAAASAGSVLGSALLGGALREASPTLRGAGAALGALATLAGAYLAVAYYGRSLPFG